jgi:hypothetical protein
MVGRQGLLTWPKRRERQVRSLKPKFESGAHRADETLREAAEARREPLEDDVDGPPV